MSTNLATIKNEIYALKDTFQTRLTNQSLNFEVEAGFAVQQLEGNDYLLGIAMSNQQSVINAVTNVAAIGVSLNPARKQAYLVPRDNKVCLDISYIGLVDLATQSGSIVWAKSELVYEQDRFQMGEPGSMPDHKFNPFAKDRGEVIGAYVVVKTPTGEFLCDAMSIKDIHDIRDRSSAWKAWISKKKSCPWVTDEGEMSKKTVIKRASKMWPKNERLNMAIQHLNVELDEGIEFAHQSRSGGAEVANKAMEERKQMARTKLIERLEDIATKEGEQSLNDKIALLNKSQQDLIAPDIDRLLEMARKSDQDVIEAEKLAANG
ncbi:recombinase RecT [Methylophilus flavus]|uniref:Recombinase RecT n=1 Tax=Methylophilus flavus TaxID=640084 RepID=A0ABW3PD27_9PROT